MKSVDEWKAVLRSQLSAALKARRAEDISALRETLAAIDNAEAASLSQAPAPEVGLIAGGVSGLGAGDVARRRLSAEEVAALVAHEIRERREAAAALAAAGRSGEAQRLKRQAELLEAL